MIRGLIAVVLGMLWAFPTEGAIVLELDAFPAQTTVAPGDILTISLLVDGLADGDAITKLEGRFTFSDSLLEPLGLFLWDDTSLTPLNTTPGSFDVSFVSGFGIPEFVNEAVRVFLYFDVKVIGSGPGQISFQPFSFVGRDNEDNPLAQPSSPPPVKFNPNVPEPTSLLTWSLIGLGTVGTWGWRKFAR